MDDDTLIRTCQTDHEAFRILIERYQARIYSFLIRLAGREAADDLFQDTWVKVYENAHRYEARGKAASWLFKIANNLALNRWAKISRWKFVSADDAAERLEDHSAQPHAALEQENVRRRLEGLVAALPDEQRQVFLMREYGQLSFKEISEALDIPLGTALSRMNYALGKLRSALRDLHA
jgi:RNA polymerase sigma-70 factor (ECF subfamily)